MPRSLLLQLAVITFLLSACAPLRTATPPAPVPSSPVKVEVINIPKSADLVAALQSRGVNAVLLPKNERSIGEQQNRVIWLGKDVPLDVLRTTMEETLKTFPLMNFLYVVGDKGEQPPPDRHVTIYIGGSTEGAIFMKLTAIPTDELQRLVGNASSIEDVHHFLHDWNRQETMIK